jgi:hypothetical protein
MRSGSFFELSTWGGQMYLRGACHRKSHRICHRKGYALASVSARILAPRSRTDLLNVMLGWCNPGRRSAPIPIIVAFSSGFLIV